MMTEIQLNPLFDTIRPFPRNSYDTIRLWTIWICLSLTNDDWGIDWKIHTEQLLAYVVGLGSVLLDSLVDAIYLVPALLQKLLRASYALGQLL